MSTRSFRSQLPGRWALRAGTATAASAARKGAGSQARAATVEAKAARMNLRSHVAWHVTLLSTRISALGVGNYYYFQLRCIMSRGLELVQKAKTTKIC